MGVVDRSTEFQAILQDLVAKGFAPAASCGMAAPKEQSQLNAWSAELGSQIHQMSLKVQDLRKLAKSKTLFDDKTRQVQELTFTIRAGIQELDHKVMALEQQVQGVGPNRASQAHASNMSRALKQRLQEVKKQLDEAVEDRCKAVEHQDRRRQLLTGGESASAATGRLTQRLPRRQLPAVEPEDLESGLAMASQVQRYHDDRAAAVLQVQQQVGQIASMVQEQAAIVQAQGEAVDRLGDDIDEAKANVTSGQEELLIFLRGISSNRALILKVLMILLFFVVFFVVFLA